MLFFNHFSHQVSDAFKTSCLGRNFFMTMADEGVSQWVLVDIPGSSVLLITTSATIAYSFNVLIPFFLPYMLKYFTFMWTKQTLITHSPSALADNASWCSSAFCQWFFLKYFLHVLLHQWWPCEHQLISCVSVLCS